MHFGESLDGVMRDGRLGEYVEARPYAEVSVLVNACSLGNESLVFRKW